MFSYENLKVYQLAEDYYSCIHKFLKNNRELEAYVRSQLGRASLSIALNIAEGSAKFSKKDRRNFYVTARGSAFECSSVIRILFREGEITAELNDTSLGLLDRISRILYALIRGLEEWIVRVQRWKLKHPANQFF